MYRNSQLLKVVLRQKQHEAPMPLCYTLPITQGCHEGIQNWKVGTLPEKNQNFY